MQRIVLAIAFMCATPGITFGQDVIINARRVNISSAQQDAEIMARAGVDIAAPLVDAGKESASRRRRQMLRFVTAAITGVIASSSKASLAAHAAGSL